MSDSGHRWHSKLGFKSRSSQNLLHRPPSLDLADSKPQTLAGADLLRELCGDMYVEATDLKDAVSEVWSYEESKRAFIPEPDMGL